MKKHCRKIIALICLLMISSTSLAEDKKNLLSEGTYKKLSAANTLMEAGNHRSAISSLKNLLVEVKGKNYAEALIQQTLGYAYSAIEDYKNATKSFKHALDRSALPADVNHNLRFNVAQILIVEGKNKEGLKYLNQWLKKEAKPNTDAYILAASANYKLQRYKTAIVYLKKVIARQKSYDNNWHQLLLNCYLETGQYDHAITIVEKMISRQPDNKVYWQQLTGIYQRSGNDNKVLATLELMHIKNLLTTDNLKQLINLYLYLNMPFKAADLLERTIKNGKSPNNTESWELLGNSWLMAKEISKASKALQKAAELSGNGQLYYRVGQLEYDLEQYDNAISSLETALTKGQLEAHSRAELLIGISAFHTKQYEKSRRSLLRAKNDHKLAGQAEWWLQRIQDLSQDNEEESA